MKILITGGCGFIGTNFIPKLIEQEHDVVIIDNLSHGSYIPEIHNTCTFYEMDIRQRKLMFDVFEKERPDVVYHFAGLVSIYDCNLYPLDAVDNNITGSINVFDAALHVGCNRVIFSETSAVYEGCKLPFTGYNESQSNPVTVYSATKASVALLAESYSKTKGLEYTALRYFNVAGPIQDYKRTVPPLFAGVALRLLGNKNPIIFGDGNRRRDFIHVNDINEFHLLCIDPEIQDNTINQTFNLGTGKSYSLFDICEMIHKYLDFDRDLEYDFMNEINGEAFEIYADITKATSLTGWEPTHTIKEAIEDTLEYLLNEMMQCKIDVANFMNDIDMNKVKIK